MLEETLDVSPVISYTVEFRDCLFLASLIRLVSLVKIISGGVVYPPPPVNRSILVILPRLMNASAVAPDPPPLIICIRGGVSKNSPSLVKVIFETSPNWLTLATPVAPWPPPPLMIIFTSSSV